MITRPSVVAKELIAFAYVQEEYAKTGDITLGLMPIFAPIIHESEGQLFDAGQFAIAVQAKYDIAMRPIVAEGLIPKLFEAGLIIQEEQVQHVAVYRCAAGVHGSIPQTDDVEQIFNDFSSFAEKELLKHSIAVSKDDLKNAFAQRLMNLQFQHELNGTPLPTQSTDRGNDNQRVVAVDILCADYIVALSEKNPVQFELLIKMAAGALIADVVLTLQQPTTCADLSDLTVVLDGPLILDMLNMNTEAHKKFGHDLLEMMKAAKVKLLTFSHIVDEMHGSIMAPLSAYTNGADAYGPLANRLRQTPGHAAYARAVVESLNDFIEHLDIEIIDADAAYSADCMKYCTDENEDSLRNSLGPLHDRVEARIIDAKSIASVMRMRGSVNSKASVIDAKIIFVTRNAQVVNRSTICLLGNGLIAPDDVPPGILDRHLAVVLWLCLGGSSATLTHDKLLANCMDALYPRPNLLYSVRKFIENLDLEKSRVFEALMRDKRAQSCLLHRTLGYAQAVTQDNMAELLDELRRCTVAEVSEAARLREVALQEQHNQQYASQAAALDSVRSDAGKLQREKEALIAQLDAADMAAIERACKTARRIEMLMKGGIVICYILSVAIVTYLSSIAGGPLVYLLCGIVAAVGFWHIPKKLFKGIVDRAREEKLNEEIAKSNVKDWDMRFHIDRDSCKGSKITKE